MAMNYMNLGLYIHIPFCYSKCPYCGFFSLVDKSESDKEQYLHAIKREIHIYGKKYPEIAVQSIYIGGGTPTVFSGKMISEILETCYQTFKINKDIEISIESNPATFDTVKAETLLKSGINRLSIGAQSFNNKLLQKIGRIHDTQDIIRSYKIARSVGFKNINIDLMFGIPGQTVRKFQKTLEQVIKLHPEHISVYGLTIEEGTPFQKYIEQGILKIPSDDIAYNMYQKAINFLYCRGYEQYEISNFALPGKRCFHNQIYWKNKEYLGIGASSTSYLKKIRFKNISNLNQYIYLLKNNILPVESKEVLPLTEEISETVILKLRMTEGIAKEDFMARFNIPIETVFYEQLEALKKEGLLQENKSHYFLNRKGIALSNIAFMKFLS
jgi:oxygen-independent coproporphyrinogen III oxidase